LKKAKAGEMKNTLARQMRNSIVQSLCRPAITKQKEFSAVELGNFLIEVKYWLKP